MSRIDQALRLWEQGATGTTSEAQTIEPGSASPLTDYPHEARPAPAEPVSLPAPDSVFARPSREAPAPSKIEGLAPSSVEGQPPAKPTARALDSTDIQARLVTSGSSSVSLEQYRRLAAVLHEEQVKGSLKTVMVTSALPSEGKTLTIANLALTLSGSYGRRVLLIDADLRAPSLHRLFKVRNTRGLTDALGDGQQGLPVIELSSQLSLLTAGRPGPTPLADLTSERMGEVIRDCATSYDWVLIDTPPVGLLPDAQVLARVAGAVIFVIAAGSTPSAAVERAVTEIGADSIIGTVLNRVDDRRIHEASYYDEDLRPRRRTVNPAGIQPRGRLWPPSCVPLGSHRMDCDASTH